MSNKTNNTAQNNTNDKTSADNAILVAGELTAEQLNEVANKTDDVVEEVLKGGKLQGVKKSLRKRSWIDIVGAGAIATVGAAADMMVTNKLNININGEDADQYSSLEIAGVALTTGLVASTLRFGLDFIPVVNNNASVSLVSSSAVGSSAFVASAYVRDAALSMIKGKLSVNVEELAEEA